jgi:hypothetical protein
MNAVSLFWRYVELVASFQAMGTFTAVQHQVLVTREATLLDIDVSPLRKAHVDLLVSLRGAVSSPLIRDSLSSVINHVFDANFLDSDYYGLD